MTTLIIATSVSKLFLNEVLIEQTRTANDTIVIATNADTNKTLKEIGVPSQHILPALNESQAQRDVSFRDLAMPGVFGDVTFFGTKLPIYKVLSIDRLSFWHGSQNANLLCEYIEALRWDRLIVSLDTHHHLPFYAMYEAKRRNAHSSAIKTHSIRTKEMYDMARRLTFDSVVVEAEEERTYLSSLGYSGEIIVRPLIERKERTVASPKRDGLRKGLGVSENERIVGIVFDKRYEWSVRKFMSTYVSNPIRPRLLFFAFDDRSKDLLPKCTKPYDNFVQLYTHDFFEACDQIVAFGWDDYLASLANVSIVDYNGINKAKAIAPSDIQVFES